MYLGFFLEGTGREGMKRDDKRIMGLVLFKPDRLRGVTNPTVVL